MRWGGILGLVLLVACTSGAVAPEPAAEAPVPGELVRRGEMIVAALRSVATPYHREEHFVIERAGEPCGLRFCTLDATGSGQNLVWNIEECMAIVTQGSWQVSRSIWTLEHDWRPRSFALATRTTQLGSPPLEKAYAMKRDGEGYQLAMRQGGKDFSAHIKEPPVWFCSAPELMIPWLPASDRPYSLRSLLFESGDVVEVRVIPHSIEHREGLSYHVLEMRTPGQTKGELLTVASEPAGVMISRTLVAAKAHMKLVTPERTRQHRTSLHLPPWPDFPR